MAVKIGISLIAWQNDDLPELTKDYTTEGAMEDAAKIGYSGVERGRRMPADTEGLRAYLDRYGVSLCGGWCSGSLMVNDIATEKEAIRQQVEQCAALNAPCIVYAECSNPIQGMLNTPVSMCTSRTCVSRCSIGFTRRARASSMVLPPGSTLFLAIPKAASTSKPSPTS